MKMRTLITKAHKSWTLMFNWLVTILAIVAEMAIQNTPALKEAVSPEYYIYVILAISVVNKILRAKTSSSLEDK